MVRHKPSTIPSTHAGEDNSISRFYDSKMQVHMYAWVGSQVDGHLEIHSQGPLIVHCIIHVCLYMNGALCNGIIRHACMGIDKVNYWGISIIITWNMYMPNDKIENLLLVN